MSSLKALNLLPIEYSLQSYHRSNQDTTLVHKPLVKEGDWVQSGDLLSDCSASVNGEFSIGHNILIAYLPWEGYNYEDAILISERLVYDDLYTSVHIERYDVSIEKTPYGNEQITRDISLLKDTNELNHLDKNGIAQLGSWLKEGDILVGKITPLESKKEVARYIQLYNEILGKTIDYSVQNTSLRVPRGLEAKVIKIQTFPVEYKLHNPKRKNERKLIRINSFGLGGNWENPKNLSFQKKFLRGKRSFCPSSSKKEWALPNLDIIPGKFLLKSNIVSNNCINFKIKLKQPLRSLARVNLFSRTPFRSANSKSLVFSNFAFGSRFSRKRQFCFLGNFKKKTINALNFITLKQISSKSFFRVEKKLGLTSWEKWENSFLRSFGRWRKQRSAFLASFQRNFIKQKKKVKLKTNGKKQSLVIKAVNIYLAEKRKVQVGDKMAGRHGNKGIISQILPRQDMPYLPDGTPIDMALNPLGVPSRMNVGQIYECLLGLAGKHLGEQYRIKPFDESFGPEASRSFVFSKLYEAKIQTGQSWIFQPTNPGKLKLYDGRTGNCFDQPMTSGYSYMIKLVHLVDDKLHCLTQDHDVLTTDGWISISNVTTSHLVATIQNNGQLVYQNPTTIYNYSTFKGKLYKIKNSNLDLCVTLNHRMYVKSGRILGQSFDGYELVPAQDIIGKHKKYLKMARWDKTDYQFILPSIRSNLISIPEKPVHMQSWLQFFGIWMADSSKRANPNLINGDRDAWSFTNSKVKNPLYNSERFSPFGLSFTNSKEENFKNSLKNPTRTIYSIQFFQCKQPVKDVLEKALKGLGYTYSYIDAETNLVINNKQLWSYLKTLSIGASDKKFPTWVWELSQAQARLLLESMILGDVTNSSSSACYYHTSSIGLADDVMRLALHAGWSGNKYLHIQKGSKFKIEGRIVVNNYDIWRVVIIKNKNCPAVNYSHVKKIQEEIVIDYQGPVYCLSVPNEVFYVRRNGFPVWTGNSRSTGPYSLITQQPLKGRSKHGGQRLGEMEVWAIEAYGAAFTLLELLTIKSDDVTGRLTIWDYILYKKPLYIGTPASFKVMVCELQALCLDIGIYKTDQSNLLKQINISTMG